MIELRWKWQTVDVDDSGNPQKKKVLQFRTIVQEAGISGRLYPCGSWSDWMDVPTVRED